MLKKPSDLEAVDEDELEQMSSRRGDKDQEVPATSKLSESQSPSNKVAAIAKDPTPGEGSSLVSPDKFKIESE